MGTVFVGGANLLQFVCHWWLFPHLSFVAVAEGQKMVFASVSWLLLAQAGAIW